MIPLNLKGKTHGTLGLAPLIVVQFVLRLSLESEKWNEDNLIRSKITFDVKNKKLDITAYFFVFH